MALKFIKMGRTVRTNDTEQTLFVTASTVNEDPQKVVKEVKSFLDQHLPVK